jgi:hypothetical protein
MEHDNQNNGEDKNSYTSLIVIVAMIALAVVVSSWGELTAGNWMVPMTRFMAGYFLVFSGFKFVDLSGFAEGYSTYDLLAKRWRGYGYVYPFLELGLGLAYLTRFELGVVNWVTLILMVFSGIGVMRAIRKQKGLHCACLGTKLDLPLSTVTVIEDFGMAAMAALMLLFS